MDIIAGLHFRQPDKPVEVGDRLMQATFIVHKVSRHNFVYFGIDGDKRGWVQPLADFEDDIRHGRKIVF